MTFDAESFNESMNGLKDGMKFMIRARKDERSPAHFMAAIIKHGDVAGYSVVGTCWTVTFHDWTIEEKSKKVRMYQRYMGINDDGQPEVYFTNVFTLMTNTKDIWEITEPEAKE